MKLAYFPNQIALNGQLTLRSFLNGAKKHGFQPVENSLDADAAVIWSVLWNGRLAQNKVVYDTYRSQGKPVFILEVGALKRGYTWKVAVNNITSLGIYGNQDNLDPMRSGKIGIKLTPPNLLRNNHILIAGQHQKSLQWEGQTETETWMLEKIKEIRQFTDRPIVIRPHPRSRFVLQSTDAKIITPIRIPHSHEEYDIDYNCHCVINHNSGPSTSAIIKGTPVICDESSLAWPMSATLDQIEKIQLPDRDNWFLKICHTEWTNVEINNGDPLARIMPFIKT
jgi:hypothetical protein